MRKTELDDLMTTVERIRKDTFPDLDSNFLQAVVKAEEEYPEDKDGALREIKKALTSYLAELEKNEC